MEGGLVQRWHHRGDVVFRTGGLAYDNAAPSVCCMVTTSDKRKKSKMRVSTDECVAVEYWGSSSIRIIFVDYQTSKLQCNY